jgi:hypothetical protein
MAGEPTTLECLDFRGEEFEVVLPHHEVGGDSTIFHRGDELHFGLSLRDR